MTTDITRTGPKKSAVAVMQERFATVAPLVTRRNSERTADAIRSMVDLSGRFPDDRERALARLEKIPGRCELKEQREQLRLAVYVPATEVEARAILGLMLEGIRAAASGATVGYGDALAFSIAHADDDRDPEQFPRYRGFSAAVLFATARRLWATSTFTPSIAEVLEVARKVRAEHYAAFATTNRLLDLRFNAEGVVEDTNPIEEDVAYDEEDVAYDHSTIPF